MLRVISKLVFYGFVFLKILGDVSIDMGKMYADLLYERSVIIDNKNT